MRVVAILSLIALFACARAEWQESRGGGALAQEQAPPQKPAVRDFPDPQKFGECTSQTLKVEVDTSTTQISLKDFETVIARYSRIRVTKAAKTKKRSTFYLNAQDVNQKACADEACAEDAGWSMIQDDIRSLNDTEIQCEGQPAPTPIPTTPTPKPLEPGTVDETPGSGEGLG